MNAELSVSRPAGLKRFAASPFFASESFLLQQFFRWGGMIVLAFASYLLISHFVLQSVQVVGVSMAPTLHDSDHYFLNRWAYHLHPPKHRDIVVIKDPTDGVYVVKRIIATPGESILFKDGYVYVNGKKLTEPYIEQDKSTYAYTTGGSELVFCGKDQYFVLGDNRNNSFDSRIYGPVHLQNILGTVIR